MTHKLHNENILFCEPGRFRSQCLALDNALAKDDGKFGSIDEGYDIWGDPMPKARQVNGVSVIPFSGVICDTVPRIYTRAGFYDLANLRSSLMAAALDSSVRAIAIDADSPGGSVRGCAETAATLATVNAVKPVYVYTQGEISSAAYYVLCGAKAIFATAGAQLGAVGVYANIQQDRGFWESMGIRFEMFKSGKYKGAGETGQDLTDDQRQSIQARIDKLGAEFRSVVSKARARVAPENMQGQSFTGAEAFAAGFCDNIVPCDLESLIVDIANLTSRKG
jgi:signal peptide peptidase SppA